MKKEQKISIFRKYWIIIASIWVVFVTSMKLILRSLIHKLDHKHVNAIAFNMGSQLLNIVRVNYEVIEQAKIEILPNTPYIIMSNHLSHYDIPLIFCAFPKYNIRMIAKKELFKVPIWGRAMRVSDFISIDRENRVQAIKDLQMAKEKMQNGIVIWIAPEGTRSRTGELGAFKKGGFKLAMQTGATIIPVCIVGSEKILPAKTLDFSLGEKVKVNIAKPINARDYKDISKLMSDVETAIRQAGNLPAVS